MGFLCICSNRSIRKVEVVVASGFFTWISLFLRKISMAFGCNILLSTPRFLGRKMVMDGRGRRVGKLQYCHFKSKEKVCVEASVPPRREGLSPHSPLSWTNLPPAPYRANKLWLRLVWASLGRDAPSPSLIKSSKL